LKFIRNIFRVSCTRFWLTAFVTGVHSLNLRSDSAGARSRSVSRFKRDGKHNFEKEINFTETVACAYIENHRFRTIVNAFIRMGPSWSSFILY